MKSWIRPLGALILGAALMTGCAPKAPAAPAEPEAFQSWDAVVEAGRGKTVTIQMWGGNEMVNRYMDTTIASILKEKYEITLNRVPMVPPDYLSRLMNEKTAGLSAGTADLLWINAENFRTAKEGGLLWGPVTDLLPNLHSVYDGESADLTTDSGIPIEGMEAVWGRAQLVLTTDRAKVEAPPMSYRELLAWAKAHPGRFTYPKLPEDFAGSAFVRGAYYELTADPKALEREMDELEFKELSEPVMAYFKELNPYLWREGKAFPASQAELDELFRNGETDFTLGFELGKTAGLVKTGAFPATAESYVFDTGTIGNAHYLAIPFNAPEKAAALLTIDVLQSPEAQLEKFRPEVWGDMPALDTRKLSEEQQKLATEIEGTVFPMPLSELAKRWLPDLKAVYVDWVEALWSAEIGAAE